jgi:hypothetical protein
MVGRGTLEAKAKVAKNIYVHNDRENAAFHFAQRVKKRAEDGDRDGIGRDMMAVLAWWGDAAERAMSHQRNR